MTIIENEFESAPVPDADVEQNQLIAYLLNLKAAVAELEEEILTYERLIDECVEESVMAEVNGVMFRCTPVRSATTTVDIEALQTAAPELYNAAVSYPPPKAKVDTAVIIHALETGELKPMIAARFISSKPKKTSIRLTEQKVHNEDEETDQ